MWKCSTKHWKCSTKPLSILLTQLLTHIKQGLQMYYKTAYSRSWVNQMWILKNSKELLDHLESPNFNLLTNITSFDFSTLYTTIPRQKLKNYNTDLLPSQKWKSEIQIFSFRSRGTLFCKRTLLFEEQEHWKRHYQDARVSSLQHFHGLRGKGFPTDNRHSHGHKLCPLPSRHISILVRSGIHTVLALDRKEAVSISVKLHI